MTQAKPITHPSHGSNIEVRERTAIDRVLGKLAIVDHPAKEHLEDYLRHKWRVNHKPKTIDGSFTSIKLFLEFYGERGKTDITRIERSDLETFIFARAGPGHVYLNAEDPYGLHRRLPPLPHGAGYPQPVALKEKDQAAASGDAAPGDGSQRC